MDKTIVIAIIRSNYRDRKGLPLRVRKCELLIHIVENNKNELNSVKEN